MSFTARLTEKFPSSIFFPPVMCPKIHSVQSFVVILKSDFSWFRGLERKVMLKDELNQKSIFEHCAPKGAVVILIAVIYRHSAPPELRRHCGNYYSRGPSNGMVGLDPAIVIPPRSPGVTDPKRAAKTSGRGRAFRGANHRRSRWRLRSASGKSSNAVRSWRMV